MKPEGNYHLWRAENCSLLSSFLTGGNNDCAPSAPPVSLAFVLQFSNFDRRINKPRFICDQCNRCTSKQSFPTKTYEPTSPTDDDSSRGYERRAGAILFSHFGQGAFDCLFLLHHACLLNNSDTAVTRLPYTRCVFLHCMCQLFVSPLRSPLPSSHFATAPLKSQFVQYNGLVSVSLISKQTL